MKRLLNCVASDFKSMNGEELKQSIKASEGRVIVSEVIGSCDPLCHGLSNAELAAAFGADIILLNLFDVFHPHIQGVDVEDPSTVITRLKELVGRPIGVNLEPVDVTVKSLEQLDQLPKGRIVTKESLEAVKRFGFDFICLTGNPKTGVTNDEIMHAIRLSREVLGQKSLIFAGKMHGAGVEGESGEETVSEEDVLKFIEAGADVILLPAPGTVPGITVESTRKTIKKIHQQGALTLLTIGTSQEGADEQTIREIALNSKMAGADLHHIGDAGFSGMAIPENIMTYSIAIRGKRHTYVRMATSIVR